ncbi:MAG: class I SAM-dependent methyltransferase [Oscillospiraceae bacterium]|nr:class I SAM-dependent methyltransferase [Oscillospiraceae bacterium]
MDYIHKDINEYQKNIYHQSEVVSYEGKLIRFETVLLKIKDEYDKSKSIKILDIGGGGGVFAQALLSFFKGYNCDIYVLEITEYDTWKDHTDIRFVKGSAFDVCELFENESFDIIFTNYVFHHLIQKTYKDTINGIEQTLSDISKLLTRNGFLCISECYYFIPVIREKSSFLAYFASTIRTSFLASALRKFGIKSSGVGVCFLSQKKWKTLLKKTDYKLYEEREIPVKSIKIFLREHFFSFVVKI